MAPIEPIEPIESIESGPLKVPLTNKRIERRASKLGHNAAGGFAENEFERRTPTRRTSLAAPLTFEEGDDDKKTNLRETTANCALTLVGAGVLGIPYAFGQAGYLSVLMLLAITFLTMWTAVLIGRLMDTTEPVAIIEGVPEGQRDWPFLGYVAFGDAGRLFCSFCFVSELWFCSILLIVINGTNVNVLFPTLIQRSTGIWITGALSFLLLFPSSKMLSYLSIFGILATIFGVGGLVWSATAMPAWESQLEPWQAMNFDSVPMALGIFQCCFVAHSVFPSMYRGMQDPKRDFEPAMLRAFTFAGVFYAAVGIIAYPVYMWKAEASFMANLGADLNLHSMPGLSFLRYIATSCFIVNLQVTFPLMAGGLVSASEQVIFRGDEPKPLLRVVWKFVFVAVSTSLGVLLQDCMAEVQSLVGSFCATNTCLFFPMLFTLKLCPTTPVVKAAIGVALLYSCWIMVYGTYDSIGKIAVKISG